MLNKIIHFNVRSLKSQKDLLEHYLKENNIDAAIICETWLKNDDNIRFSNYNLITSNRHDGYGGVAVLLKKNIPHKFNKITTFAPIEVLEVTTLNLITNFKIVSIYIPPNSNTNVLKKLFKELIQKFNSEKNTIIAGDINAHHSLWECDSNNDRHGIEIAEIIADSNFIVLNTGEHTYRSTRFQRTSAIDIALAHNSIATQMVWESSFENLSSDHFICTMTHLNSTFNSHTNINQQINFKKLGLEINNIDIESFNSIEEYEIKMEELIDKSSFSNNGKQQHSSKYWWNAKIERLWCVKKEKLKIFNKNKSAYTKDELNKAVNKLKMEIKRTKKEKFLEFIDDIKPHTSLKEIYNKINIFNKKKIKRKCINLNDDELIKFIGQWQNNIIQQASNGNSIENSINDEYERITAEEIGMVIKNKKNTAPGINKISYKILKMLPITHFAKLSELFNKIIAGNKIPLNWKKIKIIPILKTNKNPNELSSYRPISLINVIAKLFNKLLVYRINKHIEENNLLSEFSFGFRNGKSTHNCLESLINEIKVKKKKVN